ncbi:hypothetical protein L596_015860 [Steinernema carpocapsae]|uniref:Uncharacterized protein n=1 Tax=Steinernema carpocapsae TaxID=34508 RepID=A0A4U5NH30_STECR|nr:hypothetical protein L596_015860 [Steinernema carpocapsae]
MDQFWRSASTTVGAAVTLAVGLSIAGVVVASSLAITAASIITNGHVSHEELAAERRNIVTTALFLAEVFENWACDHVPKQDKPNEGNGTTKTERIVQPKNSE